MTRLEVLYAFLFFSASFPESYLNPGVDSLSSDSSTYPQTFALQPISPMFASAVGQGAPGPASQKGRAQPGTLSLQANNKGKAHNCKRERERQ